MYTSNTDKYKIWSAVDRAKKYSTCLLPDGVGRGRASLPALDAGLEVGVEGADEVDVGADGADLGEYIVKIKTHNPNRWL